MHWIATKPELSYLSTLIRYEELHAIDPSQARATPKEHHDGIVEHLVDNLRELETAKLLDKFKFIKEINRVFIIRSRSNLSSRSSTRMPIWKMEQGGKKRC